MFHMLVWVYVSLTHGVHLSVRAKREIVHTVFVDQSPAGRQSLDAAVVRGPHQRVDDG